MPFSQHDQSKVDDFFAEITPFQAAYRYPSFRYIALQSKGEWILFHGVLALNINESKKYGSFETADIRAGEVPLSAIARSPRDLIHLIVDKTIEVAGLNLVFPTEQSDRHSAHLVSYDGSKANRDEAGKLIINGSNNYYQTAQQPHIGRQLRTSTFAFNSIAELATHYHLKFDGSMNAHVEVHAPAVGDILDDSHIELDRAHIAFRLPAPLDTSEVSLSLRGLSLTGANSNPVAPGLNWARDGEAGDWRCVADIPFPDGKNLTCILSYAGFIQQERIIVARTSPRDSLRLVCEFFDAQNIAFAGVIDDAKIAKRDGRELEATVAAMLTLIGFRVIAVDHVPHLGELPDVVAVDPHGNLLLVECTLNLPKANDKIDKLFRRREFIREGLNRAGLDHINVLALLAVALSREKISGYLGEAQRAGLVLWGREDLHKLRGWLDTHTVDDVYAAIAGELEFANLMQSNGQEQGPPES